MKTDIFWIRGLAEGRLGVAPRPRGGDWLDEEIEAWHASGVRCVVSALTPNEELELGLAGESAACKKHGMHFVSLPIPDRGVPPSPVMFRRKVKALCRQLDKGNAVLVHCRQGIGRASLIAAAALAEHGESPDSAFARIQQSRGRPVPDTGEQRDWVRRFAASSTNTGSGRLGSRRAVASI